ncbi:MAG: hypothetical protein ACREXS_03445 [Gammaproteobacteria bacterium]
MRLLSRARPGRGQARAWTALVEVVDDFRGALNDPLPIDEDRDMAARSQALGDEPVGARY